MEIQEELTRFFTGILKPIVQDAVAEEVPKHLVKKKESKYSPKQSFTAGGQPDGNVCRAELDEVEVAQARHAAVAGTKPF